MTYILIEGTHSLFGDGVDVLEWSCREAHDEVELGGGASEEVEVMAHGNGRRLVGPFVCWLPQVRNL